MASHCLRRRSLSWSNEIILQRGFSSRSEGIRDAIRNYIVRYEMEVVVLRGEVQDVRKAVEKMVALKGVKHAAATRSGLDVYVNGAQYSIAGRL